jgi:hypothetical protein
MTRAVDIEGRGVRVNGRSVGVGAGSAIPDSVVNSWKLANDYTDSVGSDDGSPEGSPTFVSNPDAIGDYELDLDGSDDAVNTPNTTPSGSMTMLITVDFSLSISVNQRLMNSDNGSSGQRNLGFTEQGTNTIESTAANDSGSFFNITYQLSSTGRYRLGFVLDTSASELRVASQGSVQSTTPISGSFTNTASDFALGYKRRTGSEYFGGIIDGAIVADDAYTAQQLTDDYNSQPWS